MQIVRLASSNNRVTEGKIYEVNESTGKIVDDEGNPMTPFMGMRGNGKIYWETVEKPQYCFTNDENTGIHPMDDIAFQCQGKEILRITPEGLLVNGEIKQMNPIEPCTEEKLMIEDVTLINGQNAEELEDVELIEYIAGEKAHIEALEEVGVESKRISSMIEQSKANIKRLVAILDSREG